VGDIHGCHGKLERLLDRLPFLPERDTLVFLGDYIDRGPQTREVIEALIGLKHRWPATVFLLGNHELALLEYARLDDPNLDMLRSLRPLGVEETLASYGHADLGLLKRLAFLPREHREFLEGLQPFHRDGKHLFVHAGVLPGQRPEDTPVEHLVSVRHRFLEHRSAQDDVVVFGHTPFETPFLAPGKIGIDTGAVYGNLLTAVELPGPIFHHA